jgi:adenylate kinase family enzyme
MDKALLVLGPSGSGKSTISNWLAEDLRFLHLEADQWKKGLTV